MNAVSKNVYINKIDQIVDKFNNTYHKTIKMKPVDVKSGTYIDFETENNERDSKFRIGNHVNIFKHRSIFANGYTPNCS